MRIAERCNVDLSFKENYLPNFDVPGGFTLDDYFEHVVRAGLRDAAAAPARARRRRARSKHTIDEYERRLSYEIDMIKKMKYPGTS